MATQTKLTESEETHLRMKEDAAHALVGVAASIVAQSGGSTSCNNNNSKKRPVESPSSILPTNSASRKQWDQESAAPPSDGVPKGRTLKDLYPHAFAAGGGTDTNVNPGTIAETNHGFSIAASAPRLSAQQQQQQLLQTHTDMPAPAPAPPMGEREWSTHPLHAAAAMGAMHPPSGHPHAHFPIFHGHGIHHQSIHRPLPSQAATGAAPASSVFISMSSIGFGVDSACSGDATEAAARAIRDAMERSAVRLPTASTLRQNLSLHVKLGVPPRHSCNTSGEHPMPMHVDVTLLVPLLPQSVTILPVEVVVGGLLIDHKEIEASAAAHHYSLGGGVVRPSVAGDEQQQDPLICTAVASVTLQQTTQVSAEAEAVLQRSQAQGRTSLDSASATSGSPWGRLDRSTPQPKVAQPESPALNGTSGGANTRSGVPSASSAVASKPPTHVHVHRTNSMEMLARVSGEIRDRQRNVSTFSGANTATPSSPMPPLQPIAPATSLSSEQAGEETPGRNCMRSGNSVSSNGSNNNNAYSYKKLAPGMTPKNNKRLFVKHCYRDYSNEEPLPDEHFLVRSQDSVTRTPNAAFPLKLHETLTQIEQDGYANIIGWLSHGRSFKIRQQQEFVNTILPKYFVMTKKSSFLRQLNLYGFNRISVGPDGGSYYHEKFLRGLKFLCRRMARLKVNGNGIRAAGNPDDEPNLLRFPVCPPGANSCASSITHENEGSYDVGDSGNSGPCSKLLGGASRPQSQIVIRSVAGEREATTVTDENASHDSSGGGGFKKRGSVRVEASSGQASFPLKLQRILDKADADEKTDIISWLPHGRAFLVHDVDRFVSEVMSQYFNQTKYSSFQRQLHMYNFQRITFGRDKGAYHHPTFQRGKPDLCLSMVRTRVNGKGCRRPGDPDSEPDFYEMEALPAVARGSVVEIPMEGELPTGLSVDEDSEMRGDSGDESQDNAGTVVAL